MLWMLYFGGGTEELYLLSATLNITNKTTQNASSCICSKQWNIWVGIIQLPYAKRIVR